MTTFKNNPSIIFLVLSLLAGIFWIFLMPAGAGYDEETHLARIYEISRYHLIPNSWLGVEHNGIPESMMEISFRQKQFLLPVTFSDIQKGLSLGIEPIQGIKHETRATYSPFLYILQGLAFYFLGYHLHISIQGLYWILRFTYLISYVIAVFFAIRLIPKFKWTLFVLALAPMALIQAVSISADPQTNGMSFLFVAWSLYLVEGKKSVDKKNFWITMLLVFFLFSVKPNSTPLVLLLILLKPTQFPNRRTLAFFWLAIAALFLIEVGGWTIIQFQAEAARRGLTETQTTGFLTVFLSDPLGFIANLVLYVVTNLPTVFQQYIAGFGYGYYAMPTAVYIFFLIGLGAGILHDWQLEAFSKSTRILLALAFIFLFFGTFALRFAIKQSVGSLALSQGRYFIPFIPLLIFSLFGGQLHLRSRIPYLEKIIAINAAVLLSLVTVAMYLVYYVPCGMYLFAPGQCVLPVYKNWAPSPDNALPVNLGSTLEQTFQPDCGRLFDLRFFTFKSDDSIEGNEFSLSVMDLQTEKEVVNQKYPTSRIKDGAMTVLDFPSFKANTNSPYSIRISSTDPADSYRIALSDRHRIRGSLFREGEPIDKDLLFQYRCEE